MNKIVSIVSILSMLSTFIFAASCSSSEFDKVEYFAEKAANKIVSEYGGGQYVNASINDCRYNSYTDQFRVKLDIKWRGKYNSDNSYESDGTLKMLSNGSNSKYEETYANSKLREYKNNMMWLVGTVLVLGALNNE